MSEKARTWLPRLPDLRRCLFRCADRISECWSLEGEGFKWLCLEKIQAAACLRRISLEVERKRDRCFLTLSTLAV